MERGKKKVDWSDLPKELWPNIGKCLDNSVGVLRFRSVCKLWRSSIPSFQRTILPPMPHVYSSCSSASARAAGTEIQAVLYPITVYRMEALVDGEPNSSKPWLVKFEESPSGKLRLRHPITNSPLRNSPDGSSKQFNLLDFGIVELSKSYALKYRLNDFTVDCMNKVVVLNPTHLDNFTVMMMHGEGQLYFARFGDEKWTLLKQKDSWFDDIIAYKGHCYVVDREGIVSCMNSEFKVIQFSPPLGRLGEQKHLVESGGDLYVVDRFTERQRPKMGKMLEHRDLIFGDLTAPYPETVSFKVYKLEQEWGRWVEVNSLGDQVFVLSHDDSFSVSTRGVSRVKGNCILFTDQKRTYEPEFGGPRTLTRECCVFNLENGSITNLAASPGYSLILQPPSAWLSPD
ncbi:unnamed protein product [Prunus armeniaca]|uniref:KIB1-4 beta-propeller domain-containing protein n=1 Tax=Prunus armeniaca TaxID=36596 RepID=A0A6J5Y472_PRUAR|nr:hypothetical protein GBA52_028955 [Prunus armeniaca]CAB4287896.1 unnamed protein product [Prunus armeniaca]CAB4318268.1 unnamed protein product [Prunus armeniaca]